MARRITKAEAGLIRKFTWSLRSPKKRFMLGSALLPRAQFAGPVTFAQNYDDREQFGRCGVSLESSGVRFSKYSSPRSLSLTSARPVALFHDSLFLSNISRAMNVSEYSEYLENLDNRITPDRFKLILID